MTSLRTIEGLDLKLIENIFSTKQRKRIENSVTDYITKKMMINDDERLVLTDEGKLFADGIASQLFMP